MTSTETITPYRVVQHNDIPNIDMSSLFLSAQDEEVLKRKREVGEQIRSACETTGFFRIVGHGLSVDELQALLTRSQQFFTELPEERKMELAPKKWRKDATNEYRGYFPASVNGKEGLDIGNPTFDEDFFAFFEEYAAEHGENEHEKEFIKAVRDVASTAAKNTTQRPHHLAILEESNHWLISPSLLPPSWRVFMVKYYSRMFFVGLVLLRGFALALDLPETYFECAILNNKGLKDQPAYEDPSAKGLPCISDSQCISTLRLNYYPPVPAGATGLAKGDDGVDLACEVHVDGALLTLLYQPQTGGLQVEDGKGWIEIEPDQQGIVVNTGLCMQRWSGEQFKAANHRVRLTPGQERVSVPFFFELGIDTIIDPTSVPNRSGDSKSSAVDPISYGEYINISNRRFKEYQRDISATAQ